MKKSDFLFFGVFVLLVVGCAAQTIDHFCFDCNDKDTTKGPCYKPIDGTTKTKALTDSPGGKNFQCWGRVPTDFNKIAEIERGGDAGVPTNGGKCIEKKDPSNNQMYMVCYCNNDEKCVPDFNKDVIMLSTSSTTTTTVPPSTLPLSKVAPLYLADGDYGALFSVDRPITPPSSSPMTISGDILNIDLNKAKDNRLRTYLLVNKGAKIYFWFDLSFDINQQVFKDTNAKLNIAGFPLEMKLTQTEKKISSGDRSVDLAKLPIIKWLETAEDGSLGFFYFGFRDFAPGSKKQTFDIPYLNKEAILVDITVTQAAADPKLKFAISSREIQLTMYKPFVDLTPKPDHETIILLCIAPLVFLFPIAVFIIVHCIYKKVYLKPSREDTSARTSPVDTKRK